MIAAVLPLAFFTDIADNPFLVTGLLAGILASISCGIAGPYVVTRRIVFLAGAIAHIALSGIGASLFLRHYHPDSFSWLDPLTGAAFTAVAAALLLAWVEQRARERVDTLIGALWAAGMAIGILLIKFTPGYHVELMGYLFGNLVFVSPSNIRLLAVLSVVVALTAVIYHKRFLALSLDPEQAELQGVSTLGTSAVLLVLVALTVITLTQVVGLILVIALLTLPAATALRLPLRMPGVIAVSILLCALLTTIPRILVYGTRISPESAIVLAAVGVYLLTLVARQKLAG